MSGGTGEVRRASDKAMLNLEMPVAEEAAP